MFFFILFVLNAPFEILSKENKTNLENDTNEKDKTHLGNNTNTENNDNSIYYKAEKQSRSELNENLLVLSGNAEVKSNGYIINADEITFNTKNGTLESIVQNIANNQNIKKIKITTQTGETIYCSSFKFNVESKRGIATNVLMYKNGTIILTKYIKLDYDGTAYCKEVSLTSCNKKKPDWAIIANKGIINLKKQNFVVAYGANLMFLGTYFPLLPHLGIPYFIPQTGKSGLKYFESVNFGSKGNLYFKNFGFFIHFSKNRNLDCNISLCLGEKNIDTGIVYNYVKKSKYNGKISLGVKKIALYEHIRNRLDEFKTSWYIYWDHKPSNYGNYEFNIDVQLLGSFSDNELDDSNEKKELHASFDFTVKKFLKKLSLKMNSSYNKDLKTQIENLNLFNIRIPTETITFLKYLNINPSLEGIVRTSNKKNNFVTKDEHDIDLEENILSENYKIFSIDNLKKIFKNNSIKKITNILKLLSCELKLNIPLSFKYEIIGNNNFSVCTNYSGKLFFSKYDITNKTIKFRKIPYYVHGLSLNASFNTKKETKAIKFDPFNYRNLLHMCEIKYEIIPRISLQYSPSSNKFQKLFGLEDSYKESNGKTIDLFAHTQLKNIPNNESLVIDFSMKNSIKGKKLDENKKKTFEILNFGINCGYDFLKKKCKMNDIKFDLNTKIWKLEINANSTIFPYYYKKVGENSDAKKEDDWFFNRKDVSKKIAFKKAFLNSSIKILIPILKNSKKNNKENKKNEEKNTNDQHEETKYDDFHIWENLNINVSYNYEHRYNPIKEKNDKTHTISLNLSTMLSKKCNVSSSITYNLKDKSLTSFSINGIYNFHCWSVSFSSSLQTNIKQEKTFSYNVSLSPKLPTFNFLSQRRTDVMDF